jgi:hypothetical protein
VSVQSVVSPLSSPLQGRKSFYALSFVLLLLFPLLARAQAERPALGRLVGEDLIVLSPAGETFVGAGNAKMLTSGSEVRVRSGEARLELLRGGLVQICGPAHFTLLGSGDQLTLALESGRVEVLASGPARIAIYTAQIVAHPVEISGEPVEFMLGVEATGAVCIRAGAGAVELEEQLTSKKLIVPQGGEMLVPNGRLADMREAPGGCRCRVELAGRMPQAEARPEPAAQVQPPEVAPPGGTGQAPPVASDFSPTAPALAGGLSSAHAAAPERATAPAPPQPVGAPPEASKAPPVAPDFSPASISPPTAPPERAAPLDSSRGVGAPPEASPPVWKVIMPPLVFNAPEPSPPPPRAGAPAPPSPEIVQLVRETRVAPALVIRGEVVPQPPQKKRGFWSKVGGFFAHLFGRHSEPRA